MAISRCVGVLANAAVAVVPADVVIVLVVPVWRGIGAVVGLDCEVLVNQGELAICVA